MKGFYRAAGPLRQVGRSWPSNPQENGQNFKISALKSAKKGQGFDDFWASNPQNCGQETSEASRGLECDDLGISSLQAYLMHMPTWAY